MPLLFGDNLERHQLATGHYGYSATRLSNLGAAEYTLVTIVCDVSPSVSTFCKQMEEAIKQIVVSCQYSPRADNLLIRLMTFDTNVYEPHGYKLLQSCNPRDYDGILSGNGGTALFDAAENAVAATVHYGKELANYSLAVNAIVFVITDGEDNSSKQSAKAVKAVLDKAKSTEALESMVTVLVGVNVQDVKIARYLQNFYYEAGFSQYIELDNANAATLARLADFVSRSISSQSQSLGGGGGTTLTF
jgi:uncharacterized protein YegL